MMEKCCKCGGYTAHPVGTPRVGKFLCEECGKDEKRRND